MTDDDPAKTLSQHQRDIFEKGGEMQWARYLSESVLALLERDGTLTRDTLEAHLYTRCEDAGASVIDRAALHGAVKAIRGNPPRH